MCSLRFTAQVRFPSEGKEELTLSSGVLWNIPSEWAGAVRKCPEPQPHLSSVPLAGTAQTLWAHAAILRSSQGRSFPQPNCQGRMGNERSLLRDCIPALPVECGQSGAEGTDANPPDKQYFSP